MGVVASFTAEPLEPFLGGRLLDDGEVPAFRFADFPVIHELNVSAGVTMLLGDNFQLMVGGSVPVVPRTDRVYDYQIGIRGNWFFGPTAFPENIYGQGRTYVPLAA